ncbi:MAG TPA: hypothetical protein VLI39_16630 [Sedimentisphaerales bacterium]|nr:hypothetical protein [Sedimentisphaerales bacterium]
MAEKKEATARIKINRLLESAGWRFFAEGNAPANIQLEPSVTIKSRDLDALGDDFEKVEKGFIDFLLLNEKGFPFIVLEAKAEDKEPLLGRNRLGSTRAPRTAAPSFSRTAICTISGISNEATPTSSRRSHRPAAAPYPQTAAHAASPGWFAVPGQTRPAQGVCGS